MTTNIQTEIANGIMTVRFNRPDKRNALTHEMYAAMADAFTSASTDRKVRVIVVTGNGEEAFTAGNDLKEFVDDPPTDPSYPVFKFMKALSALHKPVIAAVNGSAIGIGVTMLLHCDFVYAAPGVRFQLPFATLAIVPEFASSLLLRRFVGERKANELLMMGTPFMAEEALDYGFINGIVPADKLLAHVNEKAAAMVQLPPGALRKTKTLIRGDLPDIEMRMEHEDKFFAECLGSDELKEAIQAFYDKRKPDFSKFD